MILILVLIPAALGLLSGLSSQRELIGRIYSLFGLNPIHPTPHAWEHVFFNSPPSWVFITLKNGNSFAGFWGGASFASSDVRERDLYISQVFDFFEDKDRPWTPSGRSLFVGAGEISTIEFIPLKQETR